MSNENTALLQATPAQEEPVQTSPKWSLTTIIKFAVLFIGAFMASLDTSFVIATYNYIASEFDQASIGPWVLNAYNLGYSILLPLYGAVSDRYGSLPCLMAAHVVFSLGCAVSGSASAIWHVILGRALAGAGGAGMVAMVAVVITETAPPDKVAVYRSYINLVSIAGRSSGGPIGGFITDAIGWRWSFFGQIFIAVLCWVAVTWMFFSSLRRSEEKNSSDADNTPKPAKRKRTVDFPGIITFAVMMTSFLVLITDVEKLTDPSQKTRTIVLAIVFALSLPLLIVIEAHYAKQPLVPVRLMRGRLGAQMLIQFFLLFAQFAIISNAASYFVRTERASNTTSALHLLAIPIGNAVGALAAGRIIQWTKRYKVLASVGICSSTIGFGLMTFRWRGRISVVESLYLVLTSLGVGTVNSTQFVALTIGAPKDRMATIVSLFLLSQQVGMMVGTSSSAAILNSIFQAGLTQQFGNSNEGQAIVRKILDNTRYAFKLPQDVQKAVITSFTKGFTAVCGLSTGLSVVLQIILGFMKEQPIG